MTNFLSAGIEWLAEAVLAVASNEVVYSRGVNSVTVNAIVGKTVFEVDKGYGVIEHIESRDFLIRAEDLVLESVEILPHRGDRVADLGFVYEVLAPGNEPPYRFSDSYRKLLRIHTKQIG